MNISQAIKNISTPVKIGIVLIVAGGVFFLIKKTTTAQTSQPKYETAPVTKGHY